MRFLYICPVCKKAYSAESAEPDDSRMCPVCAENLIYAGCDKTAWDQKSDEAKREYKDMVLRVFAPGSVSAAPAASSSAESTRRSTRSKRSKRSTYRRRAKPSPDDCNRRRRVALYLVPATAACHHSRLLGTRR